VLLFMLSSKLELDDRGVGSTRSQGSMNFCKVRSSLSNRILKDCLGVQLVANVGGKIYINSNYLQCVPRNIFTHNEKPRFLYSKKPPKH
jgi:hypothetical protein